VKIVSEKYLVFLELSMRSTPTTKSIDWFD
jgi:hypothetical protein